MYSIGQSFEKKYPPEVAVWCNKNNAHIEKQDDKYVIVENPQPSIEDKKYAVRKMRDKMLVDTDKYMLSDYPITEKQKQDYIAYRTYLRDYTKIENWYLESPKEFESWLESQTAVETSENEEKITTE